MADKAPFVSLLQRNCTLHLWRSWKEFPTCFRLAFALVHRILAESCTRKCRNVELQWYPNLYPRSGIITKYKKKIFLLRFPLSRFLTKTCQNYCKARIRISGQATKTKYERNKYFFGDFLCNCPALGKLRLRTLGSGFFEALNSVSRANNKSLHRFITGLRWLRSARASSV